MNPQIFVSVGSAKTAQQSQASDMIFRSLEAAGLSPKQVDRNEWIAEQPLRGIKRVVDKSDGLVVIAFSRYEFPNGIERQKNGSAKDLSSVRITTVWNHIEATLGYARGIPLLVIAENQLLEDGMLEGRYDWSVYWSDFTPEDLRSDRFLGHLRSWQELVTKHRDETLAVSASAPQTDLSKRSIGQLLGDLNVSQVWAVGAAAVAVLLGVATLAFKLGETLAHR
jgi:hypothetical protein